MEIKPHAVQALLTALLRDVEAGLHSEAHDNNHVDTWMITPPSVRRVAIDHYMHHYRVLIDVVIHHVEHRGPGVLLIDLPTYGKHFDKGLSSNFDWKVFDQSGLSFKPKQLKALFSDIFDDSGRPHDSVTPNMVFYIRQVLYLFKKYSIDCPDTKVKEAVNDFIKIDQGLREPSGSWYSDHWVPGSRSFVGSPELSGTHSRAEKLWGTVDAVFRSIVPMHEVDRLRVRPKHGPGAVADMKTGGDKYSFPYWPSKLEANFPFVAFGQHREDLHIDSEVPQPSRKEPPARLIAVPKTFSGPRLIASEPIAHQFLQQGLMEWIRDHMSPLLRNTITFTNQEYNQQAALTGSKYGDLATVDLSSASDRLSCWTVERALASNQSLLECLHAVRTRNIIDATGTDPNLSLRLKKFAAQGSAVTFPVQTIIYAGLSIAAVLFVDNRRSTRRNIREAAGQVRVFGDDIVLPSKCVPLLTLMLNSLELKVNALKTHASGSFRESCGMDAYKGYEVTPLYIKTLAWNKSPEKAQSFIDVCNNAHKAGLWNISALMESWIPKNIRKKTITIRSEGDGIRLFTFCRGFSTQAQIRDSQSLFRLEVRVFSFRTHVSKKSRGSWNDLYQFFVEAPDPQSKWTHGYVTRKTSRLCEVWVPIYMD